MLAMCVESAETWYSNRHKAEKRAHGVGLREVVTARYDASRHVRVN